MTSAAKAAFCRMAGIAAPKRCATQTLSSLFEGETELFDYRVG
jgi:hypothetical protein